jgi:hypothetical protein
LIALKTREKEKTMSEQVNHPSHYNQGRFEVIEIIEDQQLNFHLGNAIKYICRAGKKDPAKTEEDLKKAIWYINRYIEFQKDPNQRLRPNDMSPRVKDKSREFRLHDHVKIIHQNYYFGQTGVISRVVADDENSNQTFFYVTLNTEAGEITVGPYSEASLMLMHRPK